MRGRFFCKWMCRLNYGSTVAVIKFYFEDEPLKIYIGLKNFEINMPSQLIIYSDIGSRVFPF